MGMIGRERELDAVSAVMDAADRLPINVVLAGEPGIGKTTVWNAAVERATAAGMRVLGSRPAGSEVRLTFSGLTDLLTPVVDEVLPFLPGPQRRAIEVALLRSDDGGRPLDQRAVLAAVLTALRGLATDRSLCVAVDDAQWLDGPSAEALVYAARRLRSEAVLFLLAVRTGPLAPRSVPIAGAMSPERTLRVELEGLTIGALHRLVQARHGRSLSRPLLRRIHETAGGNPFYALELAAGLESSGGPTSSEPLPLSGSLEDLLGERLATLPAACREALLVASAAARPTLALLQAVFGTGVRRRLAAAERAGIVTVHGDSVAFTHPLLASAAYGRVESEHRRWHGRLGALATDVEDAARHRALAVDGPDEEVAAALMEAGRHARARGAPAIAAELFEAAVARTPLDSASLRSERIVEVAPTIVLVGDRGVARDLVAWAVEAGTAGPVRSDALRMLADLAGDDPGGAERSAQLLDQAMAEAGPDHSRQASVLLDLVELERSRDRPAAALATARRALAVAEQTDDRQLLTHALTRTADFEVLGGIGGDPVERFARAIALDRETRIEPAMGPVAMLAVCLIRAGRLAEARPLLDEVRSRANDEGDESGRVQIALFLTELEWLAGNWEQAWAHGSEALELAEQAGSWLQHAAISAPLALIEGGRGAIDAAIGRAAAAVVRTEELGEVAYAEYNRQVIGSLQLARGDAVAAAAMLGHYSVERGVEGTKRISFIGDEIEALIQLDRGTEARQLIVEVERRAQRLRRPPLLGVALRGRALLASEAGDAAAAEELLTRAGDVFGRVGFPLERARSMLWLGVVRRRAKRKRAAREALLEAVAGFEAIGAIAWAGRARDEMARIGGRTATRGLTTTELRVAELVANGLSNKEVAATLFVSVRAVEANLSRVYAKLQVDSRTELVHRL